MIDTLKIMLTKCVFRRTFNPSVRPSVYRPVTGEQPERHRLWTYADGESVFGMEAYLKMGGWELTIKPFGPRSLVMVQFSVPNLLYGDNSRSVGREATQAVLKMLQDRLLESGVETDIMSAVLVRVDLLRDVVLSEPIGSYTPILHCIKPPRMDREEYEYGYLWKNRVEAITIYDKQKEAEHRHSQCFAPTGTVRTEYRMMKARKVRETLGISTVAELCDIFGQLDRVHGDRVASLLFSRSAVVIAGCRDSDLLMEMRMYQKKYGRRSLERLVHAYGLRALLDTFGMDSLIRFATDVSGDRKTASRLKKAVADAMFDHQMVKKSRSGRRMVDLYTELMEAVLGCAKER